MKNSNPWKKAIIISMVIIFGLCNVISISGYGLDDFQIIQKPMINNFVSSGEGLLASYKFDEGHGYVAFDYSGHNYHGTIYGATWIAGHSGYALEFNGIDNYVSMDLFADDLAFNKTDDYKISLWLKSTSIQSGIIFEMSDESDFVPRAYIELKDDGTLEFKVQSTEFCEISYRTNESYNDGNWHFIECIYHGDSSYPTIDLYVDNEFAGTETEWLCPMNSDQFKKAKIGVRGYEGNKFFKGVLDEVKIFKKPDGNQVPNPPMISGPSQGTVGEQYNYTFSSSDPEEEDIYLFIDWGDNSNTGWIGPYGSNEEVEIAHTWNENDIYSIKAKTKDGFDNSNWTDYLIAMGNVAPETPSISGPNLSKKNILNDFSFVSSDLNGHDIKYFIDWDDGTTEWTDFYKSSEEVTLSHTWSEQGNYFIKVKAKDTYDSESQLSEPFNVKITQKAFLFGLIGDKIADSQSTDFSAKLVMYLGLSPFNFNILSSNQKVTILNSNNGIINDGFIFGSFQTVI